MHYNVFPYICSWEPERETVSIMSVELIEKAKWPTRLVWNVELDFQVGKFRIDREDLDVIDEDADAGYMPPMVKDTPELIKNDASRQPNALQDRADTKEPGYSLSGRKRRDTAREQD